MMLLASRSFGWCQDSGSFSSLKKILQACNSGSDFQNLLRATLIPTFVPVRYDRQVLLNALDNDEIPYNLLKGKGTSCQLTVDENIQMFGYDRADAEQVVNKGGRGNAAASGIAQLCLTAQKNMPNGKKKPYQGDWQCECFIRLGVSLGFFEYNYNTDCVKLSEVGKAFAESEDNSADEKSKIGDALLSYPPACRVLELLNHNGHMTKFEIGKQLGFQGEAGFTSVPQNMYVSGLCMATSPKEKTEIRQNCEGSADKYARMIAGWFCDIGWVTKATKTVTETFAGIEYTADINQAYMITLAGKTNAKRILGSSSQSGVVKIVLKDMLATKATDRDYLRNRRALILEALSTEKNLETIKAYLSSRGLTEDTPTIKDDIDNFVNIGLHIKESGERYKLLDRIIGLVADTSVKVVKSNTLVAKDNMRSKLKNIDHRYLVLMDLCYDSDSNRDFEIETMSLLTDELQYRGSHLGGASKPDGVFYLNRNGVIVDTKAYSKGYSLPISQADEMIRYIEENKARGDINPNKWWENYKPEVSDFSYLFVSSEFTGGFQDRLDYIKRRTDYDGGVITAENLLLFAEEVMSRRLSYPDSFDYLRQNREIIC